MMKLENMTFLRSWPTNIHGLRRSIYINQTLVGRTVPGEGRLHAEQWRRKRSHRRSWSGRSEAEPKRLRGSESGQGCDISITLFYLLFFIDTKYKHPHTILDQSHNTSPNTTIIRQAVSPSKGASVNSVFYMFLFKPLKWCIRLW